MTLDRVHAAARSAFVRAEARVVSINVHGWSASIVIDTSHRGGQIRASEMLDLAQALEVDPSAVAIWDGGPERCEILIDLEERTPVDNPNKRAPSRGG